MTFPFFRTHSKTAWPQQHMTENVNQLEEELKVAKSEEVSFTEAIDSLNSSQSTLPCCSTSVHDEHDGDNDTGIHPLQKKVKEGLSCCDSCHSHLSFLVCGASAFGVLHTHFALCSLFLVFSTWPLLQISCSIIIFCFRRISRKTWVALECATLNYMHV